MKTEVVVYRFISILLLPVTALFGFSTLLGLVSVIVNPSAIVGVLLIGSIVFYIISSFIFLNKGITNGKQCKPALRNGIRISSIVTALFCLMALFAHFILLNDTSLINPLAAQMMKQPNLPSNITQDTLVQSIRSAFTFFMILSLVLLLHIIMSFRLLNEYSLLFQNQDDKL